MAGLLCFFAVPRRWTSFDLADPNVEADLAAHVRRNWAGVAAEPELLEAVTAAQLSALRQARDSGVVAWAVDGEGTGAPEDPLSFISLTVGLYPLDDSIAVPTGAGGAGSTLSGGSVKPLAVGGDDLVGFTHERQVMLAFPGAAEPVSCYQAQSQVASEAAGAIAVCTVTTPDSRKHREAREVAVAVASTVRLVPAQ